MTCKSLILLSAGLLASLVNAQASPGVSEGGVTGKASTFFNVTNLSALFSTTAVTKQINQFHFTKSGFAGLKPGQWAVTMTVPGLDTKWGGDGTDGVVLGKWDRTTKPETFTISTDCSSLNGIGKGMFGLMIEPHEGKFAVVDWSDFPRIAYRAANALKFTAPITFTALTGTPAIPGGYVDPAITKVNGQLAVFYTDGLEIAWRPLTYTVNTSGALSSAVLGKVTSVWKPSMNTPHSPSPMIDSLGNCVGLNCALRDAFNDSDMYLKTGLQPKDAAVIWADFSSHFNNGGTAGGSFFFADWGTYSAAWVQKGAWMLGSNPAVGKTATITVGCHVPSSAPAQIVNTQIAMSIGTSNTPFALPGIFGKFGLNLAAWMIIGVATSSNMDETASFSAMVPNDPKLSGLQVAIQGLSMPLASPGVWTNTSYLTVQ